MKTLYNLCLVVLLSAATLFADVQSTATVTGTHKGQNMTLPAPFNTTVFAGTFNATVDGNPVHLYCIDLNHNLAYNQPYQDVSSTDSMLTYVLNNYYPFKAFPYPGALSTEQKEAAAVQLALWHYADGLNLAGVTGDAAVVARAQAIVADANLNAHVLGLSSFFVDIPPQNFTVGQPINFTVKAFDNLGIAMPNVNVTLSASQGTLSTTSTITGPTGVTPVITITPVSGQTSATISVSGTVGIPAGTKYFHVADPNGKQKLILATPTVAHRNVQGNITWFNQIELTVAKSANLTIVNDGDVVVYTIVVKNIGQVNASNVQVSDQLSAVFDFISAAPSGVYNPLTGIWNVGNLAAGDSSTLTITVQVDYSNVSANSFNFGAAQPFNLFVIDTLTQPSADTQGKLAVGGYADLTGYSVGDQLPLNSGDVLVVGNHLTYLVGRVYHGRAVYQNYITSTMGFSADDGIVQDSVLDFPAAKLHLENLSAQLATLAQTDTNIVGNLAITLNGSQNDLNVFYLDGNLLWGKNQIEINAPANSTVLVNISGDSTRLFGGFFVNGTTKDKVLLNFYEAEKVVVSGIDVTASVLAPFATLDFAAGIITGQTMVRCMFGSGQFNLSPFTGNLTRDTTIANFAEVVNATVSNMPGFFNAPGSMAMLSSGSLTSVKGQVGSADSYELAQNYPNPFNPSTVISFNLPAQSEVSLTVFDMLGREIATLAAGTFEAGQHNITFDAARYSISSGVYVYRLTAGKFSITKKMILNK